MGLQVLTYNIHKGFNWNNTQLTLNSLKKNLNQIHPDIVFLQEVVGENSLLEKKFDNWITNQFNYLADGLWDEYSYSKHAIYDHSDHGNVILSKYPIVNEKVFDISVNKYEKRAVLYCQIQYEQTLIDCYCVHLNLLNKDRTKQYSLIKDIIKETSAKDSPIILAGDFNDWSRKASQSLMDIEEIHDAYKTLHGKYAKTFPSIFPLMSLDRTYIQHLKVLNAQVLDDINWKKISDHLPVLIELELK